MVQVHSLVSVLSVLQKRYARWLARWRAKSATNFKLRLGMLLGFGVMITVIGAALYRWSNPEEDWSSSLFTVYAVLYSIPGADITNNPSLLATFVLNLIFIFGLLVFATILAMITDEINNVLLAARSGKAPVALTGHILLLNWNQQVPFILDQLEQIQLRGGAHPFANRPLVILADKDKEELDSLVAGLLKHGQLEVHTRSGKPYKLEHLQRVAAADAFAVLLMHPEASGGGDDDESEGGDGGGEEGGGGDDASVSVVGAAAQADSGGAAALKLQTIMALTSLQAGKKVAMVVQAPDDSNIGLQELDQVLLRAGHPANLMNLPVRKMVNSLAVQTTLQPWSATIYHNILQQGVQPSLAFTKVPETLFLLKSSETGALGSPTAGRDSSNALLSANGTGRDHLATFTDDCTVSFEEARVAVSSTMLTIGYVSRSDGQLHLNPSESSRLTPGDMLVALTTRDEVAASGVKLPLSARIQAAALKASLAVGSHPAVTKISPAISKIRALTQPKAAAAATMPATASDASKAAEAGANGANSSSSSSSSSSKVAKEALSAPLDPIHEGTQPSATAGAAAGAVGATSAAVAAAAAGATHASRGSDSLSSAAVEPTAAATAPAVAVEQAARPQQVITKEPEIATAVESPPAAAAVDVSGPLTPEPAAPAAAATAEGAPAASTGAAAVAAAAAAGAAGPAGSSSSARALDPVTDAAAAASDAAAVNGVSADAAADAAKARATQQQLKPKKKKQSSLFACCFAPSAVEDDDNLFKESDGGQQPPKFGSAGKATSFKLGDIGKTVTGAVTTVGKGVTTVGKGVTSAVTTVADGAVGVTKTVVTGAVSTVADGAALVGKTVVSTATAMTDVVTTVADGAVGLGKTVATGAVSTVAGGAGLITKTVTTAVKAPLLTRSESSTGGKGPAGLLAAPTGWLFGGPKKQNDAKAAAFGRLANVDVATARAPPAKPLRIVVAGFSAEEGASELLPHFLDFAPANSTVTFVVKEASPPEGFEAQGTIEEDEEREDAEPLHHCIHYTFMPAANPTSGAALAEAGVLQADAVLLAAEEGLRSSPAEADAAVLSCLVSIQHLLASKGAAVALSHSRSLAGRSSNSGGAAGAASASSSGVLGSGASSIFNSVTKGAASVTKGAMSVTKGAANLTFKAAATAVTAAKSLSLAAPGREDSLSATQQGLSSRQLKPKVPHIVACVSTTSSKAVAAAFFGPPSAGQALGAGAGAAGGLEGSTAGVVGSRLFTYELLVPGEIEGSVLVQVANEPLYVKVVHEMLVTSEGCELYLLAPAAFGFSVGEELAFAEVQEVGRLLRRTAIGVVSDGRIELVPDITWRWTVKANDRIAAIADSW